MNLSVNPDDLEVCPVDAPVSVVDEDTGEVKGCFKTVGEAEKAKSMVDGSDMSTEPDLFARCMVTLPRTITW